MIGSVSMPAPINHSEMYRLACILPITPQIPFGPVASYAIDPPLSIPAVWLAACRVAVELSLIYCHSGNAWFKPLSRAFFGLTPYLDGLGLKGTCPSMSVYHYLHTTLRCRSSVYFGWVTVF
jgi:hypothetical protein